MNCILLQCRSLELSSDCYDISEERLRVEWGPFKAIVPVGPAKEGSVVKCQCTTLRHVFLQTVPSVRIVEAVDSAGHAALHEAFSCHGMTKSVSLMNLVITPAGSSKSIVSSSRQIASIPISALTAWDVVTSFSLSAKNLWVTIFSFSRCSDGAMLFPAFLLVQIEWRRDFAPQKSVRYIRVTEITYFW